MVGQRAGEPTASSFNWPACTWPLHRVRQFDPVVHLAREQSGNHARRVAIGNVLDVDAGHLAQQFAGKVLGRADADVGEIELAGRGLGQRDQPFDVVGGEFLFARRKQRPKSATHETGA